MSGEKLLLLYVYGLLIGILAIALYFRGSAISTWAIAIVMVIVIIEAVYILWYNRYTSLCSLSKKMWCDEKD